MHLSWAESGNHTSLNFVVEPTSYHVREGRLGPPASNSNRGGSEFRAQGSGFRVQG